MHHVDFGDNKFPNYLENKKTKHIICDDEDEENDNVNSSSYLSEEQIATLSKYVPKTILSFLTA